MVVSRVVQHELYNSRTLINDIGVVLLLNDLVLSTTVALIQVPQQGFVVPDASQARISGWGATNNRGDRPAVLQTLIIPVISNTNCGGILQTTIRDNLLCAGGLIDRDTCWGELIS